MVSSEKSKELLDAEVARQNAPDKKCPTCKTQIVKKGTLCPYCGVRVT
jgi:rRNA maturation endonuclease Nob1